MCIVCIERAKGTITAKEALSALRELVQTTKMGVDELDHVAETFSKLKKEVDQEVTTQFSDKAVISKMNQEKDELVAYGGAEEYEGHK